MLSFCVHHRRLTGLAGQNYVIQFVLEHGQPHDRTQVIAKLRGQMLQMARHKFASNVCEKALICADAESRHILIEEIMMPKQDGANPVLTMMKDQFASKSHLPYSTHYSRLAGYRLRPSARAAGCRRGAKRSINRHGSSAVDEHAKVFQRVQ